MKKNIIEDTIAAVSTPIGEGGIGIVRLSGSRALRIADEIFVSKDGKKPSQFRTYTTHYGHIVDKSVRVSECQSVKGKEFIDEVILTIMRAPRSYTKEDIVEINCHGGIQAVKKVLELVVKRGARVAEPGEFTKRAFLNGRIDLTQAEAVLDLIRAKTESSMRVAVSQLEGELSKNINEIRDRLIDIASHVEASIDFPDEEAEILSEEMVAKSVKTILADLRGLLETADEGLILREGILAVICGKPNVGKSSLMNLLLKRDRVIVTPVPGTTRDAVEEMINIKGIPIRLVDTAGIAKTDDIVEKEGIRKSRKYLALADIVILMLDNSTRLEPKDLNIIKMTRDKRKAVVINKSDMSRKIDIGKVKDIFKNERIIEISVTRKQNIGSLEKAIADMIWKGDFTQGEGAMITNVRQKELLRKALKNIISVDKGLKGNSIGSELIAIDLKEAISNLGLIVGKSVAEDVLDRIFERFCIGK